MELLTFGHGTQMQADLVRSIEQARIERIVDVRTIAKSRMHPWVWGDRMAVWVPDEARAEYIWERDLGGFRTPQPNSNNTALRNAAFRGCADYMETERFRSAFARVIDSLASRVAVMCSETLWWRCHRRLIADAAVLLHDVNVFRLMPKGALQKHAPTAGVRREGDALRYAGQAA